MNNYWVTNFNADQRGGHSWTYYLTSSNDVTNGFATRFGWGCRIPYLTRVIPGSGSGDNNWEGSFIKGWPSNVILVSAKPQNDGKSCILHLRETDGMKSTLNLKNGLNEKEITAVEIDATGKPVVNPSLIINPLESKFFRVLIAPL
jgi:alpha-mannosidase